MNKRKNLSILVILIVLLTASFGGFGYYIYKERLNKNNQEIMLNEVKNSVMDRNYKKAHSITKILKEKYPQNTDIAMLENTLSELANNSPFESKDLQRDTANQILDKIQGKEQSIPINNENSEIAFNNKYIKDTIKIENYADRKKDNGIEKEDILDFNQTTVPENLSNKISKIVKQQEANSNSNESTTNRNLFNLKKLKENLNKELNQAKINTNQLNTPKQVINTQKQNEAKPIKKNTDDFRENKTKQINEISIIKKPKTKIESTNIKNTPQNQITETIRSPYNYATKKTLYEILDNINTGNLSLAKERLNKLIKKGLDAKFNKVIDLIDKLKNQEASNLLIKLIKQDIEPNSASTEKAPFKKGLLKQEHPKKTTSPTKDHSIDNQAKVEEAKTYVNQSRQTFTDLNSLKMIASANEENKDFKKAEEIYEKIASITNNEEDHYKVGIMKFKLKKYEESIKAFDKTILLNPKHKKAYTNIGTNLILLNKPKQAIEAFKKAIAIDHNYDTAYYKKGIAEEQSNDKQNSFLSFKKAYEITKNPHYASKAGIIANHLGDFKNGEKYLDKAIASIKEKNDIIFYNLAMAKFENDNLNESLKIINKALNINPEKPEYLYLKASIYLTKENYNEAIPLYNAVILKNPDNITAHINLARAYEKLGNELKAIEVLEKIKNKNHLTALNNLGILYKNKGNYKKAIEIFQQAEANSSLEAKYNLATTLLAIKDNKRAMEKLKEYIKVNPNNPEALHALGIIEYNENGNDKILKEVITKFPNYKKNKTIIKILGK
ncbi:tetratricopeptide repeat protein [Borrelia anserina]|uniref:Cell surface protein n=2 Tax=Borrelia anserina TaxID=143 RepID=A0ABN4UEQ1_BORAN|nr:tetratricopeptide repeat protein [Borrelia anserina]AHH08172.1 Putative tetratricopeptide repeat domain protein [Borrelia anserina BA2]APR64701.1 cell surface protein [Borrelia anserina Es]UPA06617.1 tetratricopeptide repeat protein [Borrelia anserina]